jgi:hypothetical protein
MGSAARIFDIGRLSCRWMSEYVTLDKTLHNLLVQHDVIADTYYQTFLLIAIIQEDFIINIIK